MYKSSVYKGFLVAVIFMLILAIFCLVNLETGTPSYYVSIFSIIIDVPFMLYLLYKIWQGSKEMSDE